MNWILSTEEIQSGDRNRVGGKGYALSLLVKNGFRIPRTVCITSDAYHEFVLRTGLPVLYWVDLCLAVRIFQRESALRCGVETRA
jgi:phosphoenolpyruvate synthase/pyruvate phosphate dikinase